MEKKDALFLIFLCLGLNMLFFGIVYSDSKIYIHLTRYFLGISENPPAGWLSSRPLLPLLVAPLASQLYIPIAYGLVNTFFWIGSALLAYFMTAKLIGQRYPAIAAAVLLSSSPPTLLYFGSVMLEGGSTFFTLLTIWLYFKFLNRPRYLLPLIAGIGVLAKESTLPAAATILLLGVLNRNVKNCLKYIAILAIPVLVWQTYTTITFGENYITHYLRAGIEYSQTRYGTPFYADAVDILKALALGHFPLAAPSLLLGFMNTSERRVNLTYYALLAPALMSYLAWPFRDLRIAVVAYYATMPIAGVGFEDMVRKLSSKPLIDKIGPETLRIILYAAQIAASVLYVYTSLGRLSPPWDIYLFAPSSLQAGL